MFPVRFYGDGADTIGLNSFELLSMISVSPMNSHTMKTRFVHFACAHSFILGFAAFEKVETLDLSPQPQEQSCSFLGYAMDLQFFGVLS